MNQFAKLLFLSLILVTAAPACAPGDETPEVHSQAVIITLQTTPSLEHWLPDVADCAGGIPDFAVVTQILPVGDLDPGQADLILRLGDRLESDPFVALIGVEQTVILGGPNLPVETLSLESLQKIFSGEINNWNQIPEVREAGVEINQFITTLSYPTGHELRLLFEESYFEGQSLASDPLIFSSETALANLLETYPLALSYTLENLAPPGAQRLTIRELERAQHKVLAVTPEEPTGKLRQLLLCLQNYNEPNSNNLSTPTNLTSTIRSNIFIKRPLR